MRDLATITLNMQCQPPVCSNVVNGIYEGNSRHLPVGHYLVSDDGYLWRLWEDKRVQVPLHADLPIRRKGGGRFIARFSHGALDWLRPEHELSHELRTLLRLVSTW